MTCSIENNRPYIITSEDKSICYLITSTSAMACNVGAENSPNGKSEAIQTEQSFQQLFYHYHNCVLCILYCSGADS